MYTGAAGTLADMNNRDFAKLAKTPRPDRFGSGGSSSGGRSEREKEEDRQTREEIKRQQLEDKKAKAKAWRIANAPQNKKKQDDDGYRDRASERRQGGGGDYADTTAIEAAVGQVGKDGQVGALQGEGMSSLEASKYLGGDMAHTHLVKGLDFQLLNKVRDDLKKQEVEAEKEKAEAGDDNAADAKPTGRTALAKGILVALSAETSYRASTRGDSNDGTKQDKKKKQTAVAPPRSDRAKDIFRPGRTIFRFEHTDDQGNESAALPSRVQRSVRDCPKLVERREADIDPELLGQLEKIVSYISRASGLKSAKPKKKKKGIAEVMNNSGIVMTGSALRPKQAGAPQPLRGDDQATAEDCSAEAASADTAPRKRRWDTAASHEAGGGGHSKDAQPPGTTDPTVMMDSDSTVPDSTGPAAEATKADSDDDIYPGLEEYVPAVAPRSSDAASTDVGLGPAMGPTLGPAMPPNWDDDGSGYPEVDMYPEADSVADGVAGPAAGPSMPGPSVGPQMAADYESYPEADEVSDVVGYPDAEDVFKLEQERQQKEEVTAASLVRGNRVTEADLLAQAEAQARGQDDEEIRYGYKPPKPSVDESTLVKLPKEDTGYGDDDEAGYLGFGGGHVAHVRANFPLQNFHPNCCMATHSHRNFGVRCATEMFACACCALCAVYVFCDHQVVESDDEDEQDPFALYQAQKAEAARLEALEQQMNGGADAEGKKKRKRRKREGDDDETEDDVARRKQAKENTDYQKVMELERKKHGGGGEDGDKKMSRKERRAAARVS